ncbi:proteinase-activated receptor 3-like [Paramacrobiotus metropolitanus]|uniref:proteinase-activated receptor 3-like n=1 Tax=Paramacrobiotus metropolitanus TaxID=2943436 RepID=UPI00244628E5|nr:proteinase-activated receptor 3-like [Paramacrobiotus metropolitanus]
MSNITSSVNTSLLNAIVNSTADDATTPNFPAISTTIVFILSVSANILVLYLFYRISNLTKKPFNVFMLNLIITDFIYCVWENAFDIGINFYPGYWKTRNSAICSVYIYSNYLLQAATCNAHLLITLNRLWAILFPHSYKTNQKVSVFVGICGIKWAYLHVVMMPGFVNDHLYYRKDVTINGCFINLEAQPTWNVTMIFLLFIVPLCVMVVAFPFIFYKHRVRQNELRRLRPSPNSNTNTATLQKAISKAAVTSENITLKEPQTAEQTEGKAIDTRKSETSKANSQPILILTLLTLSATICWTPNFIVYTYYTFVPFPDDLTIFSVVTFLYSIQLLMDPILFIVALNDLRAAFFQLFTTKGFILK